jgi:hypothetical protein
LPAGIGAWNSRVPEQRCEVEVVLMCVSDHHGVDAHRQILQAEAVAVTGR